MGADSFNQQRIREYPDINLREILDTAFQSTVDLPLVPGVEQSGTVGVDSFLENL
jgi:hypothetical protein